MAETTSVEQASNSRIVDALSPLSSRPYRLVWLGSTTSSLGDAVVQIALVFAVLHIGGTASDIGTIPAARPSLGRLSARRGGVGRPVAAAVRDAGGRRRARRSPGGAGGPAADRARASLGTAVGAALYGASTSFFDPASMALIPETVPAEQFQQANSLLGLPQSFFSVAGPP